tara:strand:- start:464 stop:787 length:324 start_codon:yes stop_codon:yes gene_type:complete
VAFELGFKKSLLYIAPDFLRILAVSIGDGRAKKTILARWNRALSFELTSRLGSTNLSVGGFCMGVLSPHPIANINREEISAKYLIDLKIIRNALILAILANVVNIPI